MAANPFDNNDEPSWMKSDPEPSNTGYVPPPQPQAAPPQHAYAPQQPPQNSYQPPQPYPNEEIRQSTGPTISWQDPAQSFVTEQVWAEYGGTAQLEKEIEIPQKLSYAIRTFHILGAFFVGLAATLGLIGSPDVTEAIVLLYMWGFGIMLCMFETPLKVINQILHGNCGFMEHAAGRFMFLLLVGSLCFAYGVWGIIAGILCLMAAALNLYAGVVYQRCCMDSDDSSSQPAQQYPAYPDPSHNPMQHDPPPYRPGQPDWQQPNDGIDV
jgi:hypothetical protein